MCSPVAIELMRATAMPNRPDGAGFDLSHLDALATAPSRNIGDPQRTEDAGAMIEGAVPRQLSYW
jgi:hypothetical protein